METKTVTKEEPVDKSLSISPLIEQREKNAFGKNSPVKPDVVKKPDNCLDDNLTAIYWG